MARRSTKYKVIKHNRLQGVAKGDGRVYTQEGGFYW